MNTAFRAGSSRDITRQRREIETLSNGSGSGISTAAARTVDQRAIDEYRRREQLAGFGEILDGVGGGDSRKMQHAPKLFVCAKDKLDEYIGHVWRSKLTAKSDIDDPRARLDPFNMQSVINIAEKMVSEHPAEVSDAQQKAILGEVLHASYPYWTPGPDRTEAAWQLGRQAAFRKVQVLLQEAVSLHRRPGNSHWSHNEQSAIVRQAVRLRFPYNPRDQQIEALRHLIFDRTDLILIARTSFGKSTVIQAFSLLLEHITLVILPLNRIGKEQEGKIRALGGRPLALNAERRSQLRPHEWAYLRSGRTYAVVALRI